LLDGIGASYLLLAWPSSFAASFYAFAEKPSKKICHRIATQVPSIAMALLPKMIQYWEYHVRFLGGR